MRQESTTTREEKYPQDDRSASYAVRDGDSTNDQLPRQKNITEVQESKIKVVWTLQEAIPRIRRKKDSGDGTTWEKKARKTEAEMDGLCQQGHESHRNDKR